MTDEMIKALAAKGGVIQINFAAAFLDENYRRVVQPLVDKARADARAKQKQDPDAMRKELQRIFASAPAPLPPLSRLVDHIDHVVKLAGPDHVGLGSDFDGVPTLPAGLEDCSRLPAITAELLRRGYSDEDVVKILGANTLRLMEAVEKESRRLSAQKS
jgi:membrane dipeptidase